MGDRDQRSRLDAKTPRYAESAKGLSIWRVESKMDNFEASEWLASLAFL